MPIHEYVVLDSEGNRTNVYFEKFFKSSSSIPDYLHGPDGSVAKRVPALIAKTSGRWGDTAFGTAATPFYDRGLGARYSNSVERDKIMKAKGMVSLDDVGGDAYFESRIHKDLERKALEDSVTKTYVENLQKFGGDKMKAVQETFPAKDCVAGKFDPLSE